MKAITIKQPWASLICEGIKDIENRTWKTEFRGRVLIHSAAKSWIWHKVLNYLTPKMREVFETNKYTGTWLAKLQTGAIIGSVEIVDCTINHPSIWAERHFVPFKPYNWVLANPILFDNPIPNVKGRLSFWDYELIICNTCNQPLKPSCCE